MNDQDPLKSPPPKVFIDLSNWDDSKENYKPLRGGRKNLKIFDQVFNSSPISSSPSSAGSNNNSPFPLKINEEENFPTTPARDDNSSSSSLIYEDSVLLSSSVSSNCDTREEWEARIKKSLSTFCTSNIFCFSNDENHTSAEDPLDLYCSYLSWMESNFPSLGPSSGYIESLEDAVKTLFNFPTNYITKEQNSRPKDRNYSHSLTAFNQMMTPSKKKEFFSKTKQPIFSIDLNNNSKNEQETVINSGGIYSQSPKYLEIWLKYAENCSEETPLAIFNFMWKHQIGTSHTFFYKKWCDFLEYTKHFDDAYAVLEKGINHLKHLLRFETIPETKKFLENNIRHIDNIMTNYMSRFEHFMQTEENNNDSKISEIPESVLEGDNFFGFMQKKRLENPKKQIQNISHTMRRVAMNPIGITSQSIVETKSGKKFAKIGGERPLATSTPQKIEPLNLFSLRNENNHTTKPMIENNENINFENTKKKKKQFFVFSEENPANVSNDSNSEMEIENGRTNQMDADEILSSFGFDEEEETNNHNINLQQTTGTTKGIVFPFGPENEKNKENSKPAVPWNKARLKSSRFNPYKPVSGTFTVFKES